MSQKSFESIKNKARTVLQKPLQLRYTIIGKKDNVLASKLNMDHQEKTTNSSCLELILDILGKAGQLWGNSCKK